MTLSTVKICRKTYFANHAKGLYLLMYMFLFLFKAKVFY